MVNTFYDDCTATSSRLATACWPHCGDGVAYLKEMEAEEGSSDRRKVSISNAWQDILARLARSTSSCGRPASAPRTEGGHTRPLWSNVVVYSLQHFSNSISNNNGKPHLLEIT